MAEERNGGLMQSINGTLLIPQFMRSSAEL
jgi:hypothetical protein